MSTNPFQTSKAEPVSPPAATPPSDASSTLTDPVLAYTANGNLEAHSVVTWLESNGVEAHAVEDNAGVGTFAFGTVSQFHKPQVFVQRSELTRAHELLQQFEDQRKRRTAELEGAEPIVSQCEECGVESEFPANQNGTTQSCPKCHRFMDVGSFDWPDDFDYGEADEESHDFVLPAHEDEALDTAARLDERGEWDLAVNVYHQIADTWPEHATYVQNCLAEIARKRDAGRG